MDEDKCNKCKTTKDVIRELNGEIAVANSLYQELIERVDKIGKRIFKVKTEVDNLENGE